MDNAPLFDEVIDESEAGTASWVTTEDNIRLRVCHWNSDAPKGTILVLPGRAEFIEKYIPVAHRLAKAGYAVASLDWRGQGLSDRSTPKGSVLGHIDSYASYQNDVNALLEYTEAQELPKPIFVLAHSMGGMIALRSLHNGFKPRAICFSAPMWKVKVATLLRPLVWLVGTIAELIGKTMFRLPGTSTRHYTLSAPFEDNKLTTNAEVFASIARTLRKHPELEVGGPSLGWLRASQHESTILTRIPTPNIPALVLLGGRERIVDMAPVLKRVAQWPNSKTHQFDAAEHEVLMEVPEIADQAFERVIEFFDSFSED